ncbi:MAG: hypothetical protein WCV84_05160 [Patescibacteria group bacterium]
MATLQIIDSGIAGATIELQPLIGNLDGAVLHMLPGGKENPEGFGDDIRDIYASTAVGRGTHRGGHYHLKLDELFFTVNGTSLWILSDFRPESPTFQKTVGIITGVDPLEDTCGMPNYFITRDRALARVRVPAGVYHAFFPLTDERVMNIAIGSTSYHKEDYLYPKPEEVAGMESVLKLCHIQIASH